MAMRPDEDAQVPGNQPNRTPASGGVDTSTGVNNPNVSTAKKDWGPKGRVNWNPPPHNMTLAARLPWHPHSLTSNSYSVSPPLPFSSPDQADTQLRGRLGSIFTPATTPDDFSSIGASRWGFQFHYNPNSVSYSAGVDNTVARASLGSQGRAAPLGAGPMGLNLTLTLNRIYDMSGQRAADYPFALKTSPEDQAAMISKLGTQYDIEYLFRVANGDPQPSTLVDYDTSDFGMLAINPVHIVLGPFKWKGYISSLSVNHVHFTPGMVPIFSQVELGFNRLITLEGSGSFLGDEGDEDSSSDTDTDGSTGSTTSPLLNSSVDWKAAGYPSMSAYLDKLFKTVTVGKTGTLWPYPPLNGQPAKNVPTSEESPRAKMVKSYLMTLGIAGLSSDEIFNYETSDTKSDHSTGNALDVTIGSIGTRPSNNDLTTGNVLAQWLAYWAKALKINYIIWANRIWNIERDSHPPLPLGNWRVYNKNNNGGVTQDHHDHIHVSMLGPDDKDYPWK